MQSGCSVSMPIYRGCRGSSDGASRTRTGDLLARGLDAVVSYPEARPLSIWAVQFTVELQTTGPVSGSG